jgi:[ribosomal protein S18]-alanine N-acetyltransferase
VASSSSPSVHGLTSGRLVAVQVRDLSPADAQDIAGWRYAGRESTYDITDVVTPDDGFHAVDHEGRLIGYCCFGPEARVPGVAQQEGTLDVGYGMRPDLVGHGMGRAFVGAILAFGVETFTPDRLRLLILDWNERSYRVAEILGFRPEGSSTNDDGTFVIMVRGAAGLDAPPA